MDVVTVYQPGTSEWGVLHREHPQHRPAAPECGARGNTARVGRMTARMLWFKGHTCDECFPRGART